MTAVLLHDDTRPVGLGRQRRRPAKHNHRPQPPERLPPTLLSCNVGAVTTPRISSPSFRPGGRIDDEQACRPRSPGHQRLCARANGARAAPGPDCSAHALRPSSASYEVTVRGCGQSLAEVGMPRVLPRVHRSLDHYKSAEQINYGGTFLTPDTLVTSRRTHRTHSLHIHMLARRGGRSRYAHAAVK